MIEITDDLQLIHGGLDTRVECFMEGAVTGAIVGSIFLYLTDSPSLPAKTIAWAAGAGLLNTLLKA